MKDINSSMVSGNISIGIGHYQSEEVLAHLAVPIMAPGTYRTTEVRVEEVKFFIAYINAYNITKII
jgi:hypothetical protein